MYVQQRKTIKYVLFLAHWVMYTRNDFDKYVFYYDIHVYYRYVPYTLNLCIFLLKIYEHPRKKLYSYLIFGLALIRIPTYLSGGTFARIVSDSIIAPYERKRVLLFPHYVLRLGLWQCEIFDRGSVVKSRFRHQRAHARFRGFFPCYFNNYIFP